VERQDLAQAHLAGPAKGATQVSLTGVSCASTSKKPFCLTVGEYVPAGKPGDVFAFALADLEMGLEVWLLVNEIRSGLRTLRS
jgi:hypothetical protein